MRILVLNAGSTSLRFEVLETDSLGERRHGADFRGAIVGIGGEAQFRAERAGRSTNVALNHRQDHTSATREALEWLDVVGAFQNEGVSAIAHRVVHGGSRLFDPTLITDSVWAELEAASDLAPLHNGPALEVARVARKVVRGVPMVAVFDTGYFSELPDVSRLYAIPQAVARTHGIRRFGFHGIAHRFMDARATALLGRASNRRVITLQLGGGCSAAAILDGRPIDTTMGLTPLEGLVMATRCGDIDPAVVALLKRKGAMTPDETELWLNKECGLLGVSGVSGEIRELLRLEADGHADASLAIRMFCARVRKCIGAYMSVLGGADAIVFGGGIGEHSVEIRARICRDMEWCGVQVDEERNKQSVGVEHRISADGAPVSVYITPVRESELIAADAAAILRLNAQDPGGSQLPPFDRGEH